LPGSLTGAAKASGTVLRKRPLFVELSDGFTFPDTCIDIFKRICIAGIFSAIARFASTCLNGK
jgi:hypothetical protein